MAVNLSIKGVPDDVARALRARAQRNHRSLQGELMAIVAQAAAQPAGDSSAAAGFPADRPRQPGARRGTKSIEQIAAEHRARFPEPFTGIPRAVDIIREARDTR